MIATIKRDGVEYIIQGTPEEIAALMREIQKEGNNQFLTRDWNIDLEGVKINPIPQIGDYYTTDQTGIIWRSLQRVGTLMYDPANLPTLP